MIPDIQLGDHIKVPIQYHQGQLRTVELVYIPLQPGHPWVVKDVLDGKKWTIPPSPMFSRTMTK